MDNANNETGFEVQHLTDNATYVPVGLAGQNAQSFSDIGLTPDRQYYYRVRAYNGPTGTNYSSFSDPSERVYSTRPTADATGSHHPKTMKRLLIFLLCAATARAATVNSNGSEDDVRHKTAAAAPGDTITLPSGKFSWTYRLIITKPVTIKGVTVMGETPGKPDTLAATGEQTTIVDDVLPRGTNIIRFDINTDTYPAMTTFPPTLIARISGLTFVKSATTLTRGGPNGWVYVMANGAKRNYGFRVDNCWWNGVIQGKPFGVHGWTCGVMDHCRFDIGGGQNCLMNEESYGGARKKFGHGSYADYPWFGTDKFWFIEDCYFNSLGTPTSKKMGNATDTAFGGRFVLRHCYLNDTIVGTHGQEGGAARGDRCYEVYANRFNADVPPAAGNLRSGIGIVHDNIYTGQKNKNNYHTNLDIYRQSCVRGNPIWKGSDGRSPWDLNADADGVTPVPAGQPGHLFYSGTASATTPGGTLTVSGSPWTPNQWVGYSVTNTNASSTLGGRKCVDTGSFNLWGTITSNTPNTITYSYYSACAASQLKFATGDSFEIHKVLNTFGQPGGGKGEEVTTDANGQNPRWLNGGAVKWPNVKREPCVGWNNAFGTTQLNFNKRGAPTLFEGNPASIGDSLSSPDCSSPTATNCVGDYYDLGAQTPAQAKAKMQAIYTAARNGVLYAGDFVYPHPLVSGSVPAPSRQHLHQLHRRRPQ